jgi:hypothetical protein
VVGKVGAVRMGTGAHMTIRRSTPACGAIPHPQVAQAATAPYEPRDTSRGLQDTHYETRIPTAHSNRAFQPTTA